MEVKVIKNESDYQQTLSTIEGLMDAAANSQEGDRLVALSLLVEKYEQKHYALGLPNAIKFRMDQEGKPD